MKKDFKEESDNLRKIQLEIDEDIKNSQEKVDELENDVLHPYIVDYDDRDRWIVDKQRYDSEKNLIIENKKLKLDPYFGRIDIEDCNTGEIARHYIGKEGYFHHGEQRIVNWQSDIGNIFYLTNIAGKRISVKNIDYELLLKRSLRVSNGELKSCETNYDAYDSELEGEIVDSFLLDVLRDKRRDRKVTDIIKTIQEDQNTILRQPKDVGFVVQGCAGSGKTMIMLHRLSYILYNKLYTPEEILVITPNKYFDSQIDDLSLELGLNNIKRMTVDEYYQELISAVTGKKFSYKVKNESNLDEKELAFIYSRDFEDSVKKLYLEKLNSFSETIEDEDIKEIIVKTGIQIPLPGNILANSFLAYDNASREIDNCYTAIKRRENIIEQLNRIKNKIAEIKEIIQKENEKLLVVESKKLEPLSLELDMLIKLNKDDRSLIQEFKSESKLEIDSKDKVKNLDYIRNADNKLAEYLRTNSKDYLLKIEIIEKEIISVPRYNFMRRGQLSKDMETAKSDLFLHVSNLYDKYVSDEKKRKDFTLEINELETNISKRNLQIAEFKEKIKPIKEEVEKLTSIISICEESNDYKNLFIVIEDYLHNVSLEKENKFKEIEEEFRNLEKKKAEADNSLTGYLKKMKGIRSLKTFEFETIRNFRQFIKRFEIESVENEIVERLGCLKSFKEVDKEIYRYQMYIKLLISTLYYQSPKLTRNLICFDEAQDLSPQEFALFKDLNRSVCVYNLYGDINQSLSQYEVIHDWNELDFMNLNQKFVLNQNYRNSYQITEYCNNYFDSNILPIGIKGETEVLEISYMQDAIEKLIDINNNDTSKRCALIYSSKNEKMNVVLKQLAAFNGMSFNEINDKKINVLTVQMIKGMEFDAVLVADDGMEINERYISYTRALDNLIICRQKA